MTAARPFLLVGLTGGIATGKSTVSAMLRGLGCVVIDADQLARAVVEPGEPALAAIVAEFGRGVLQSDGTLDRKKLGAVVFADPARRKRLEAITHPAIRERFVRRLQQLTDEGFAGIVLFDAPVMIESGNYQNMDRLVVVATDEATQIARLMARDGIGRDEAELRLKSQMPIAEKAQLADYVIDNGGDRRTTEAAVRRVHGVLLAEVSISRALLTAVGIPAALPLAVLFPVNMGNRGQNELHCGRMIQKLARAGDTTVRFVGYHWRRSGNFMFHDTGTDAIRAAVTVCGQATGLKSVARRFPELFRADWSVPEAETTRHGSVVLPGSNEAMRLVAVFLSESIGPTLRATGPIRQDIHVLSWPSDSDVICAYQRPGEGGDVGQVTRAIVQDFKSRGAARDVFGSGRSVGLLREILKGSGLRPKPVDTGGS